ncbi:Transcription factor [Basidiobolus ranarum]|uniref:Transcription factor n=1 Tax=Basidiobolus ranarum TaxID=34480 RepID=A0ABR2X397_9FUNG
MTTTLPYVKNENSEYQLPYVNSFIQSRNPFSSQGPSTTDFSFSVSTVEVSPEAPSNVASVPDLSIIAPKQNLEMEPNPFEQSFWASSGPSSTNNITASSEMKGLLPPVSSIENPTQSYTSSSQDWNQTLRTGPLSPSMLFGPQPNVNKSIMNSQPLSMGPSFLESLPAQPNPTGASTYYRRSSIESSRPVVTGWAEPLGIDSKSIPGANKRKSSDSSRSDWSGDSDMSRRNSIDDTDNKKMKSDMTPEEKRKLFLERNRKAALKCRQRKKQWLTNLQSKVEYLAQENETLESQATSLREEIINLKTLLLAHKDCPIAQANGVIGLDNLASTLNTSAMGQAMPTQGQEMARFPVSVESSNSIGVAPNTIIRF